MTPIRRSLASFASGLIPLLVAGCRGTASDDAPPSPATMGWTGVLDESSFAALHDLRADAPPARLSGEEIEIDGAKAYLALPADASAPLPAVLVIHEWWGLNDHVKHWTDRLAADGYAALAIDLYGGTVATTREEAATAMRAVDEAAARATLLAAHRFLARDPRVLARRRGVIGWCFGGGWSLQLALAAPDLDAAVVYYGRLVTDPAALRSIHAPVLGIFGTRDRGIPPASVDAFESAMRDADRACRVLRYDADHAFANPSGARYDQANAAAAWREVRGFLAARLRDA
ncbi:MAG: dienelactone hydrolase family protein [Planctomycetes bacterium]|nr:dienelactone hydrolase family protein [Planctomycetota bacterium]